MRHRRVRGAGCGSSDDEHQRGATGGEEKRAAANRSRSAPTSPIRRSSKGKARQLHRLRRRTDGSDRRRRSAATAEFQDTSFDTIFRDVAQGKFEAVASAATITEEREKTVDFSDPYYLSEQAILVKEGSDIDWPSRTSPAPTVGAQQGTTGQEFGKEKADAGELRHYPQGPDAVNALKAGTVEAVIIDAPVAENAVEARWRHRNLGRSPTEEAYGFAVAKGEHRTAGRNQRRARQQSIDDGTYAKIYEKWFKHDAAESDRDGDSRSELSRSAES